VRATRREILRRYSGCYHRQLLICKYAGPAVAVIRTSYTFNIEHAVAAEPVDEGDGFFTAKLAS
jgi:hypothetical protein